MAQLNDFIMGRAGAGKNVALTVVFIPSTNRLFCVICAFGNSAIARLTGERWRGTVSLDAAGTEKCAVPSVPHRPVQLKLISIVNMHSCPLPLCRLVCLSHSSRSPKDAFGASRYSVTMYTFRCIDRPRTRDLSHPNPS